MNSRRPVNSDVRRYLVLMKRLPIIVVLSACLSCANAAGQNSRKRPNPHRPNLPTVDLTELTRNVAKYKNRNVRVRVIYHSWFEGSEFTPTADGLKGTGLVWAGFPDTVAERSPSQIAERLDEINFHSGDDQATWFYDWQTEMLVTGRMRKSNAKRFGLHGGFQYAFVVSRVEELGSTKKFDMATHKYLAIQ